MKPTNTSIYGSVLHPLLVGYKNNNITKAKRTLATWEYLFTFLKYEGVEPTNNIAERTIRPSVQWHKICL